MDLRVSEQDNICRICGSFELKIIAQFEKYRYTKCAICDVVRLFPYPSKDEILSFYADYLRIKMNEKQGYLTEGYYNSFRIEKEMTFNDLGYIPEGKGKKLLDIGCATGDFVKLMSSYGYDAEGFDISEELIKKAIQRGLKCYISQIDMIDGCYDLISLNHVIEHVEYPTQYLEKVHSLLVKGGDLLLETPCYGIIAEEFGKDWRFFMPIEHIHLFTQKGLFRLLYQKGFIINSWVRFGSGNDSGVVPVINKKAMDRIAKKIGIGDTFSIWAKRRI